jgi:hypothetical protein
MTRQKYIERAKELRPLMLEDHRGGADSIIAALQENRADVADLWELQQIVESYEAYRQLPPELRARYHLAL